MVLEKTTRIRQCSLLGSDNAIKGSDIYAQELAWIQQFAAQHSHRRERRRVVDVSAAGRNTASRWTLVEGMLVPEEAASIGLGSLVESGTATNGSDIDAQELAWITVHSTTS